MRNDISFPCMVRRPLKYALVGTMKESAFDVVVVAVVVTSTSDAVYFVRCLVLFF